MRQKHSVSRWAAVFFLPFCLSAQIAAADEDLGEGGWVKYGEEQGISLWKKKVEGSKYVAFRGEGVIDSTVPRIAAAMASVERRLEWVSDCTDARSLETKSKLDKIDYNRTKTPWPLQDRDFVYRTQIHFDRSKKEMLVHLGSVVHASMPVVRGVVRGEIKESSYLLRGLGDGSKTWVRVEMHADPKGAIPAWAVNLVQKKWPLVTLTGLRKEAVRADVVEDPELKLYWEKGIEPTWFKNK